MELSQLEAFVAVAEDLHFSRAAKRRHLSQPALTKQIQQLESELQLRLFDRNRRAVSLTQAGTLLLETARAALHGVASVLSSAERLRRGESGTLRIGFTPSAPQNILPGLMRAFKKEFPAVHCELQESGSEQQLRALKSGALDVGILRPPVAIERTLLMQRVLTEPFIVALPKEHPLAKRKRLNLKQLAAETWIMVQRDVSPTVYDTVLSATHSQGFTPKLGQSVSQVHAALALVGAGSGIAVLPASVRHLRTRHVTLVPLSDAISCMLVIASCVERRSPALNAFLAVSRRSAQSAAN